MFSKKTTNTANPNLLGEPKDKDDDIILQEKGDQLLKDLEILLAQLNNEIERDKKFIEQIESELKIDEKNDERILKEKIDRLCVEMEKLFFDIDQSMAEFERTEAEFRRNMPNFNF